MICVGNALVDIFVKSDEAVLNKFGLTKPCHISYEKTLEILAHFSHYSAGSGGGAANVAKIAALLGVKAGFIGAVGPNDEFAGVFEQNLTEAGTELFLTKEQEPTGVCIFLQRDGEPDIIAASPSAAYLLSAKDIPESAVKTARIAVIDGFIIERNALVSRIFELADKYGTTIALDVGSVEMAEAYAADIARYCKEYPIILFMNQDEARAFYRAITGDSGADEEENTGLVEKMEKIFTRKNPLSQKIQDFLRELTGDLFPIIVVKLGAKGAMVFANGKVHRESTLAVIPREVTGAGDAFCAAFLGAWLRGNSLAECASFGNKAAREVLDVNGTIVDKKKMAHIAKMLGEDRS